MVEMLREPNKLKERPANLPVFRGEAFDFVQPRWGMSVAD
jgi:hypothetical protein